MEKIVV